MADEGKLALDRSGKVFFLTVSVLNRTYVVHEAETHNNAVNKSKSFTRQLKSKSTIHARLRQSLYRKDLM